MSKDNKIIPELRFPEFKNDGEWDILNLLNVSDIIMGSSPSSTSYNENKIGLPLLQGNADIKNRLSVPRIYTTEITKECKVGDILLSVRAPVGTVAKSLHNACIGRGLSAIRAKKPNSQEYLYQWLFSYESSWEKISQGGTFDAINSNDVNGLLVPIPKPSEQQKIALCLSSLDEVIEVHSQKLDLLKEHKKGLMQNLFPQEGEKVPKLRFKEFEKDGEWITKRLDELCKLVRGPFGSALKKEIFVKEGYAVYEQSHAIYSDFSSFRYYIKEDKFSELKRFCVKSGDLIMSCSGTMGKFAIIPQDYKEGVINQALLKLTVKKGYDNLFIKTTLETENIQNNLLLQSAGGAIKNVVSVSRIKELELLVPSIKEQQKISSCLSSLDELITAQAEKIEHLKLHKKGLMQGLFPKMNN